MPELPDIEVYVEALNARVRGQPLLGTRLGSPFLLRTADPPLASAHRKRILGVRRAEKRLVFALEDDLFLVLHLMVAGRLHWKEPGAKLPGRVGLLALDLPEGTLILTEAGTKRRAALHLVRGEAGVAALGRGGIDPLSATVEAFGAALRRENHTLKRALTDQRFLSGIGNAYSDEILHAARLSPVKLTSRLTDEEVTRLHERTREVLVRWRDLLRAEAAGGFPEGVTAFRPEMAVHGKFRQACPVCGTAIQRIQRAENEVDYCPRCQTGGQILSDRSLARLLKEDWPRTIEELEKNAALGLRGQGPRPGSGAVRLPPPPKKPRPARKQPGKKEP